MGIIIIAPLFLYDPVAGTTVAQEPHSPDIRNTE